MRTFGSSPPAGYARAQNGPRAPDNVARVGWLSSGTHAAGERRGWNSDRGERAYESPGLASLFPEAGHVLFRRACTHRAALTVTKYNAKSITLSSINTTN
jgi:hypothetical protein